MIALINGQIITMGKEDYRRGTILIDQGKIKAIGEGVISLPEGAKIINCEGQTIMPGLVDAHCHLGIYEEIYRVEGSDANEYSDPVTPQLRALDAINPFDEGFRDALRGGVTTVGICPGSANVIGGTCVALKTVGRIVDKMVVREPVGLKVAFGENPKRIYGEQKKMPITRMALAALLRGQLAKANHYREQQAKAAEGCQRDLGLEQLALVLQGEIPLRAHAHRVDDIMTALRIAEEYQVPLVIEHCTEGHLITEELVAVQAAVVIGPSLTSRAKVELKHRTFETPGILAGAGLKVALCTDHPEIPIQYLSLCAALAVREGMEEKEALRAITINGAEILGVEDRVGSLEPGKDADLVVTDGSILDLKSRINMVFINGEQVFGSTH